MLMGLLLAAAQPCWAADLDPSAIEANRRAIKLGYDADELYARGQWDEAYRLFSEANAIAKSPVFELYMARCRKNAGRLLEAEGLLHEIASQALAEGAPKPFVDARASAARERDEVSRRIARVRVTVKGVETPFKLRVDGEARSNVPPHEALRFDPGLHHFNVEAGSRSQQREVLVSEGTETDVVFDFHAAPVAKTRPLTLPILIAASAAGVSAVVGGVTFALAADKAGTVKDNCINGHCLTRDASDLDDARSLADVSTVAFVAAGVCLATATVLFLARPSRTSNLAFLTNTVRF